jgi:aminoglycoside phosphotransferase (APT) family kinase protein
VNDAEWVAEVTGGSVTRFERSASGRSRATWFVEVERGDGQRLELVLRRDTGDGPLSGTEIDLRRESEIYRALEGTAVLLPRLLAVAPDGQAVLVERSRGEEDVTSLTGDDRAALAESFVAALATLHNVDPATLPLPGAGTADPAAADVELWRRIFEEHVTRPAPWVRYAFDWLRRHAPLPAERSVLCHGDVGPGNFLFEGTDVTAILDWEFAHVGDPMDDLAWLSIRGGLLQPFGDLGAMARSYTEHTGIKVDADRVRYYQLLVLTRMAVSCLVALGRRSGGMSASTYFMLLPLLEALAVPLLAERDGVDLDDAESVEERGAGADGEVIETLLADLTQVVMPALGGDRAAAERAGGMMLLLVHLQAADKVGAVTRAAELDDLAGVLGTTVADERTGLDALDARIRATAGPAPEILRYLGRRARRQLPLWPLVIGLASTPMPTLGAG